MTQQEHRANRAPLARRDAGQALTQAAKEYVEAHSADKFALQAVKITNDHLFERFETAPYACVCPGFYAAPSGMGAMTFLYSLENRISVVISEAISAMGKAYHTRVSLPLCMPMRASM